VMDLNIIQRNVLSMAETVPLLIKSIQTALLTFHGALEIVSATALNTTQQNVGLTAGTVTVLISRCSTLLHS